MARGVTTIVLYGDIDDEHLRVEVRSGEVLLISHECKVQAIQNQWRDRYLVSMPVEKWMLVARLIDPSQFVGEAPDGTENAENAVPEGPS